MKKKLALALVVVLAFALGVSGTFAYLTTRTSAVTNTFTVGDIGNLTLTESDSDNTYQIVPGVDITKDPKVNYSYDPATDLAPVDVFVYVTIDADGWTPSADHRTYTIADDVNEQLSWSVASAWTYLTTTTDGKAVYYQAVAANATLSDVSIIANDTITVNGVNITDGNIDAVARAASGLAFQAYAIQQAGAAGDTEAAKALAAWGNF